MCLNQILKSDWYFPSKYNLYKIYEEEGRSVGSDHEGRYHPESRLLPLCGNSIESAGRFWPKMKIRPTRATMLCSQKYRNQEFLQVITGTEENINRYTGDPIVPKFEMLKANAIGRLNGYEEFKEALNYVALTYPNNPEGKKAEQMVAEQLPKLEPKEFSPEVGSTGSGNWKVVFPFQTVEERSGVEIERKARKIDKRIKI